MGRLYDSHWSHCSLQDKLADAQSRDEQGLQRFQVGDLKLESGKTIRDFKIACMTEGTLNAAKNKAFRVDRRRISTAPLRGRSGGIGRGQRRRDPASRTGHLSTAPSSTLAETPGRLANDWSQVHTDRMHISTQM
jgi:hypothetical protein